MKPGDRVTRKWKPALGEGEVLHILGDDIVINWNPSGIAKVTAENKKYVILLTNPT